MKAFLKYFLAAFLAFFTAIVLIFLGLFGSVLFSGDGNDISIENNSVLHLQFKNEITERQSSKKFNIDPSSFKVLKKDGLDMIINQINKAALDPKIEGIFLDFRNINSRLATVQEIRDALSAFKASGKWIVAYSDVLSQKAYYLASVANEIYIEPEGTVEFNGLMTKIAFLKRTLEKIGVEMQVVRPKNNKFKSAVEPFMLDSMSAANELQTKTLLAGLWGEMLKSIGEDRGLSIEKLNDIADDFTGMDPRESANVGLITGAKYRDEVEDILKSKLNIDSKEELTFATLNDYSKSIVSDFVSLSEKNSDNKIAVIYAIGEIGLGESSEDDYKMGSDDLAKAIKEARNNEDVKAVVLRVNSPGGGVLASDVIWREMCKIRETKKVVVSMGDLAASGGYYISTPSDKIYAQENTITGSIGVFGVIPNTKGLNEDILGLSYDEVKTNKHSDFFDFTRAMHADEEEKIQMLIDDIYGDFMSKVSESRGLTIPEVDNIAQGRVWAGEDAKRIGLVDEIGGLDEAIIAAAELAELDNYGIINYPIIEIDPFQEILEQLVNAKADYIETELQHSPELLHSYRTLKRINEIKGLQMRMDFDMTIR
ncbi:MAG: protease-4 [Patiriisocius sp.]|jgi:protease-4